MQEWAWFTQEDQKTMQEWPENSNEHNKPGVSVSANDQWNVSVISLREVGYFSLERRSNLVLMML